MGYRHDVVDVSYRHNFVDVPNSFDVSKNVVKQVPSMFIFIVAFICLNDFFEPGIRSKTTLIIRHNVEDNIPRMGSEKSWNVVFMNSVMFPLVFLYNKLNR